MAMAAPEYIDPSSLAELRAVLDAEVLQGLMSKFIQDTETGLDTVEQGTSSDMEMAEILHKIAGSAAALGVVRFRQELIAAENALRNGQTTQANELIEGLRLTWNETKNRLNAAL